MSAGVRVLPGVVGLALSLSGCGGGGNDVTTPPVTVPTPVPCTQTSVFQDSGGVQSLTLVYFDFSVPDSGRLDVTMDWTVPSSPVGFYLVPANTCTIDEFNARTCAFLVRSETTVKPRKISTPSFNAGNYRWMIANYGDADESVSLQVVLSKGACAALAAPPSAADRSDVPRPPIARALHR